MRRQIVSTMYNKYRYCTINTEKTWGLFLEIPGNVSGPKGCFMFAMFVFRIKVLVILKMKQWNYQLTNQNWPVLSSKLCYYSTGVDFQICLRARKVTREPSEKRAPGPKCHLHLERHRLCSSSVLSIFVLVYYKIEDIIEALQAKKVEGILLDSYTASFYQSREKLESLVTVKKFELRRYVGILISEEKKDLANCLENHRPSILRHVQTVTSTFKASWFFVTSLLQVIC